MSATDPDIFKRKHELLKEVPPLKISTKGRYGLTIMMELAAKYGEGPISLKSIAEKTSFPSIIWSS